MYKLLPLVCFFLTSFSLLASTNVQVLILDDNNQSLPGASVQIQSKDLEEVFSGITNEQGLVFPALPTEGIYAIEIRFLGFEAVSTQFLYDDEQTEYRFSLNRDSQTLEEVTVTARRPLIRQEGDRMILDPEPIAGMSSTTLELLENIPGLFVDPDGGIFLSSTTPATILINGREQRMGQQNLATVLRSLPPGSVQSIEVIRTPSARYDAASSGGIINIILKRGVRIGRFGSVNASANQGKVGNRSIGFSFNEGGDRTSWYLNANYNLNANQTGIETVRLLTPERNLMQDASTQTLAHQSMLNFGFNHDLSSSLDLSYDVRFSGSLPFSETNNENQMRALEDQLLSETLNLVENRTRQLNVQQDLSLVYKLDTIGSLLDTRISYSNNWNELNQDYTTQLLFPEEMSWQGRGDNDQNRHYMVMQSDLQWQLPMSFVLETGVKTAFQNFESNADYSNQIHDDWVVDEFRSQSFEYEENISSAYLQMSYTFPGDFVLKSGLRMEHTRMEGLQSLPVDTGFTLSRADWFPYVYLSRELFSIAGFTLRSFAIYRKSVNRPVYQNLNPHIRYLDEFLYERGNPSLGPQFTQNIEANISLDDFPIFAVGRNYVTDAFSEVMYRDEDNPNIAVRTYDNLGENTETYFRGIVGMPPVNRYFFMIGTQYNHNQYDGFYEDAPLSFSYGSWRFFTFHALNLSPDTRLSVSGFWMHRGQQNFYELGDMGMINLGLNQFFLNRSLQVSLSVRDIFNTMGANFEFNQGSMPAYGSRTADTQRVGLRVRYNFGIGPRDRNNQAPDFLRMDGSE